MKESQVLFDGVVNMQRVARYRSRCAEQRSSAQRRAAARRATPCRAANSDQLTAASRALTAVAARAASRQRQEYLTRPEGPPPTDRPTDRLTVAPCQPAAGRPSGPLPSARARRLTAHQPTTRRFGSRCRPGLQPARGAAHSAPLRRGALCAASPVETQVSVHVGHRKGGRRPVCRSFFRPVCRPSVRPSVRLSVRPFLRAFVRFSFRRANC